MRMIENVIPVLPVGDLARSVHFYAEVLGFSVEWGCGEGDIIGSVSRDGSSLMLSESADRPKAKVWVGLADDSLFAAVITMGIPVVQEPKNRPWAYEMMIEDPDGHVLWLGTEPKADRPFDP